MKNASRVWVCNRGSAHILTQKEILEEEHRRWNASPAIFSDEVLDRCIAEYEEADAIVVPSDFARQSFIAHGLKPGKLYVQPYGVDLDLFKPVAKEDSTFRVLFVGAISIQKGIGYLLEAMKPLVERRLAELWLVGALDDAAKHILDRHKDVFVYKGLQPRPALKWHYSQASVLVVPSVQEGLALVQAQAMACGIPVIASTNTGASNLFTDGVEGFIVPARDAKAIRDSVEWLIAHPHEHGVMKSAALSRVEKLGGWNEYGERCLQMYRELVDAKTRDRLQHCGT
jgi:glycosyltransferase involved in cell wall biosynthesis